MPLDQLARQYADITFGREVDRLARDYQKKAREIAEHFAARGGGGLPSGAFLKARCDVLGETIEAEARARLDTLIAAYEKAGITLDEAAAEEISAEVRNFCETKSNQSAGTIRHMITSGFAGIEPPKGVFEQLHAEVSGRAMQVATELHRDLRIRTLESRMDERRLQKAYAAGLGKACDVFICHASEDKDELVRPLAAALEQSGLSVWYDESTLKIGDSLRRAIDGGLARSRYGIVVLSHSFFAKKWPQQELDGLFTKEVVGVKVILPIWHKIDEQAVRAYSPILAGRLAATSDIGIEELVRRLRDAMGL